MEDEAVRAISHEEEGCMIQVPATILVIDDDPHLIKVMTTALRVLGEFNVITATNGIEGLERCYDAHPDVVVVDVNMPGLDGYQVVRAIRGDPTTAELPLIILSAMAQEMDHLAGTLSGADYYLDKPLNPYELVAAITRAIEIGRSTRYRRILELADGESSDDERSQP